MGFKSVLRFIDERFEEIVGVIVLAVVVVLIFLGVVMRLGFKSGIPWQEEISRMLYVLVVYLGASYGMRSQDHIRITFVVNLLSPTGKIVMRIITDIIWMAFNVIVVILAIGVYQKMQAFRGESAVLKIPLHVVFMVVPVGMILLTLRLIQSYINGSALKDAEAAPVGSDIDNPTDEED